MVFGGGAANSQHYIRILEVDFALRFGPFADERPVHVVFGQVVEVDVAAAVVVFAY